MDEDRLQVDFDVDQWHQTLYGNAEVRVAQFGWTERKLTTIVSKSVENTLGSAAKDAVKHLGQLEHLGNILLR